MVITVGRQYGSGGREIGTALANKLGIVYYDDLLLKKAAEESGAVRSYSTFDERPKELSLFHCDGTVFLHHAPCDAQGQHRAAGVSCDL